MAGQNVVHEFRIACRSNPGCPATILRSIWLCEQHMLDSRTTLNHLKQRIFETFNSRSWDTEDVITQQQPQPPICFHDRAWGIVSDQEFLLSILGGFRMLNTVEGYRLPILRVSIRMTKSTLTINDFGRLRAVIEFPSRDASEPFSQQSNENEWRNLLGVVANAWPVVMNMSERIEQFQCQNITNLGEDEGHEAAPIWTPERIRLILCLLLKEYNFTHGTFPRLQYSNLWRSFHPKWLPLLHAQEIVLEIDFSKVRRVLRSKNYAFMDSVVGVCFSTDDLQSSDPESWQRLIFDTLAANHGNNPTFHSDLINYMSFWHDTPGRSVEIITNRNLLDFLSIYQDQELIKAWPTPDLERTAWT